MTSDTTNLMPATAMKLRGEYPLFKNMLWVPCSPHVLSLFLQDQAKSIPSIKHHLSDSKDIYTVFGSGAPKKVMQR
jgi:hypothetical protein